MGLAWPVDEGFWAGPRLQIAENLTILLADQGSRSDSMAEIEETEWSGEELLDLEELTLSPEVMLLDPNNPRLLEAPLGGGDSRIPDEIANDPQTQEQLAAQLRRDEEVQSLVTRIKSMGFVSSFERIVVRPALGVDGKYIVLEGNRRVAAVQTIKSNRAQYLNLSDKVRKSIDAIQVVLYEGDDPDVAWQIQGFRNVGGGIKEWKPYQKARYIVDLLTRTGQGPGRVAELTGLQTAEVNRLIRSYFGYEQASHDEEWGGVLDVKDFAVFNEAIFRKRNTPLAQWLGWDEATRGFTNDEHVTELLRLLKERPEGADPRIVRVNPDLRDQFERLLAPAHADLLLAFLDNQIDLQTAYGQAVRQDIREEDEEDEPPEDLDEHAGRLSLARQDVLALPILLIREEDRTGEFRDLLESVSEALKQAIEELAT
jgi:hypothetical protein